MPKDTTTSNAPAGWVTLTIVADVNVGPYALSIVRMPASMDDGLINAYYSPSPVPHVAFNAAALALPLNLRLAIAAHEVGHYALGHSGQLRSVEKEIEADRFAVQYVGLPTVRQTLTTLRKTLVRHGMCTAEVEARLKALPTCPGYKPKVQKAIPGRRRKRKGRK